jgi:hypothetical protein
MFFKRWIVVAALNILLISGAFQISAINKQSGQASHNFSSNLDATPSELSYLPLIMKYGNPGPTATPTITPTFTASPSLTASPTFTASPSLTPSATFTASPTFTPSMTFTPSPTFDGTPPSICDTYPLPTGSDNISTNFSNEIGPVISNLTIKTNMTVSIVRVSANLSANNCKIGQQVKIKGNLVGYWEYFANGFNMYSETKYYSTTVTKGQSLQYTAYAVEYGCTGTIKGAANYVEVCGNP